MGDLRLTLEKFDGKNFGLWKFAAKMVLEGLDLWEDVSGPNPGVDAPTYEQYKKAQRKAMSVVCTALVPEQMAKVTEAKNVMEVFEILGKEKAERATILGSTKGTPQSWGICSAFYTPLS